MMNENATLFVYLFVSAICSVVSSNTKESSKEVFYDASNCSCLTRTDSYEYEVTTISPDAAEEHDAPNLTLKFATFCTTPNGDNGYCIEIQKCLVLTNELNNSRAYNFLRESRCGPSNEDLRYPKVCCGRYGNYKNLLERNPLPKRCGIQNITLDSRIIGGDEASLGEFPWLAKVVRKNRFGYKSFGCSAFLVHAKHLLTAAHCIESEELKTLGPPFEVLLGEHDTDSDMDCTADRSVCSETPQRIRIRDIVVHPRYDRTSRHHRNDIAIIHLRKSVRFSDFVQPICLLDSNFDEATEYWLSGWGTTENSSSSSVKLKVAVPTASFQQCSERYSKVRVNINRSQLCAGGTNKDSCTGDSGGPLMVQRNSTHWYAAGIVSFGMGCARTGWPGVYTNIPNFVPWIKGEILKSAELQRLRRPTRY